MDGAAVMTTHDAVNALNGVYIDLDDQYGRARDAGEYYEGECEELRERMDTLASVIRYLQEQPQ
jgi:hypothetical protein